MIGLRVSASRDGINAMANSEHGTKSELICHAVMEGIVTISPLYMGNSTWQRWVGGNLNTYQRLTKMGLDFEMAFRCIPNQSIQEESPRAYSMHVIKRGVSHS